MQDGKRPVGVGFFFSLGHSSIVFALSVVIALSAAFVKQNLLLPLLFVAGMSLVDTTDGVAMLGAYGWAYIRPVRKLYYNMNITLISVLVALFIGGIEVLQVISSETGRASFEGRETGTEAPSYVYPGPTNYRLGERHRLKKVCRRSSS